LNTEMRSSEGLSAILVRLMKGPVFSDEYPTVWNSVLQRRTEIGDYFSKMELDLFVDESEGFSFLKQRESEDGEELPRLISRRELPFHTSVLMVILRKKLLEFDTYQAGARPVVEREELQRAMSVFYPETSNEVKRRDEIERHINRAKDMGLLRSMKDNDENLEIRRVIKAVISASWLADLDKKLEEYRERGQSSE